MRSKTQVVSFPKIGSQSKHTALEKSGDHIIHFVQLKHCWFLHFVIKDPVKCCASCRFLYPASMLLSQAEVRACPKDKIEPVSAVKILFMWWDVQWLHSEVSWWHNTSSTPVECMMLSGSTGRAEMVLQKVLSSSCERAQFSQQARWAGCGFGSGNALVFIEQACISPSLNYITLS